MNTFRLIGLFAVVLASTWLMSCSDSASNNNRHSNGTSNRQPRNGGTSSRALHPCDPNYSDCVPMAGVDVDCLGGDGDGPEYVKGPIIVIRNDPYELDRDGNGIACEPSPSPPE